MIQKQEQTCYTLYYLNKKTQKDCEPYHHIIEDYISPDSILRAKKMKGHEDVFCLRAKKNKEDSATRLLFTTLTIGQKPYMVLLAVVLNHDYHKYKETVLDKTWLNEARKNIEQKIISDITESLQKKPIHVDNLQSEPSDRPNRFSARDLGVQNQDKHELALKRIQHFNHQWISFNPLQEEILTSTLPNFFSGLPGSGKTGVALGLLKESYDNLPNGGHIAYITFLSRLAHDTENNFRSNRHLHHENTTVSFWGLRDLIVHWERLHNRECHFVTLTNKKNWLKTLAKKGWFTQEDISSCNENQKNELLQHRKNWLKDILKNEKNIKKVFHEFYIFAGCDTPKDYEDGLGIQNTGFSDKQERRNIAMLFPWYQDYLTENKFTDPLLYPFTAPEDHNPLCVFDLIVFDECQNGSLFLFKQLAKRTKYNRSIALCGDTNQQKDHAVSIQPFIVQWCKTFHSNLFESIMLSTTYRLPRKIAQFANILLAAKISVAGRADKEACTEVVCDESNLEEGHLIWLEQKDSVDAHDPTTTCVVTRNEFLQQAQEKFSNFIVYLSDEIQGREFDNIIFWRIFDNAVIEKAAERETFSVISQKNSNRTKNLEDKHLFTPDFNELFLIVTRAKKQIIIYQDANPKQYPNRDKKLFTPLKNLCDIKSIITNNPVTSVLNPLKLKEQLSEETELGNERVAKMINEKIKQNTKKEEIKNNINYVNEIILHKKNDINTQKNKNKFFQNQTKNIELKNVILNESPIRKKPLFNHRQTIKNKDNIPQNNSYSTKQSKINNFSEKFTILEKNLKEENADQEIILLRFLNDLISKEKIGTSALFSGICSLIISVPKIFENLLKMTDEQTNDDKSQQKQRKQQILIRNIITLFDLHHNNFIHEVKDHDGFTPVKILTNPPLGRKLFSFYLGHTTLRRQVLKNLLATGYDH